MSNNSESAFPQSVAASLDGGIISSGDFDGCLGLTKLEYAAIKAMQGVLADPHIMALIRCDDSKVTQEFVAGLSVEYAKALLAELEKEGV